VNIAGHTLNPPGGLAVDAAADLYIAETNGTRVREVPSMGIPPRLRRVLLRLPITVTVDLANNPLYRGSK
jgi:hypothetical protein